MLNFFTPAKGKEAWTCPFCPQGKMTIPLRWPKKGGGCTGVGRQELSKQKNQLKSISLPVVLSL